MTMQNEVVRFDSKSRFATEHKNLVLSLGYLDWTLRVQAIAQSCSLPLSDMLENPETTPAQGSLAYRLGHTNVVSFISGKSENYGLSLSWDSWLEQASALRFKKTYGIYSDVPSDIISEYKDVIKILGRVPFDSSEYHKAKDAVLLQLKRDSEQHSQSVINEMNERISGYIHNAELDKRNLITEQQRVSVLSADLRKAKEEIEEAILKARKEHAFDKERALIDQRSELTQIMEQQIFSIQREAEQKINELDSQINQLKQIYNSDNFVSRNEYNVLSQEIERERHTSREYLLKINEINSALETSIQTIYEKDSLIANQSTRLHEQSVLVSALQQQIDDIKENSSDALPLVFQTLNDRNRVLENYISRYRQQNTVIKEKVVKLQTRIEDLTGDISKIKSVLGKKESIIKKKNNIIKVLLVTIPLVFISLAIYLI